MKGQRGGGKERVQREAKKGDRKRDREKRVGADRKLEEEREREVKSESVISEAVLNRALSKDVLYMLMTLPHTHRHTPLVEQALLLFLTHHYCPLLSRFHI